MSLCFNFIGICWRSSGCWDAVCRDIVLLFVLIHHRSEVASLVSFHLFLSFNGFFGQLFLLLFLLFLCIIPSLLGILGKFLGTFFLFCFSLLFLLLFQDGLHLSFFDFFNSLFFNKDFVDPIFLFLAGLLLLLFLSQNLVSDHFGFFVSQIKGLLLGNVFSILSGLIR